MAGIRFFCGFITRSDILLIPRETRFPGIARQRWPNRFVSACSCWSVSVGVQHKMIWKSRSVPVPVTVSVPVPVPVPIPIPHSPFPIPSPSPFRPRPVPVPRPFRAFRPHPVPFRFTSLTTGPDPAHEPTVTGIMTNCRYSSAHSTV